LVRAAAHLRLAVVGPLVWAAFWVLGWPDYYQQYSTAFVAFGTAALVPPTIWIGWRSISRAKPEHRVSRAAWLSFYFTVPFFALDYAYCGLWLGEGIGFVATYWYLTAFYFIPWIVWMPMPFLAPRAKMEAAS
jgi:hypothetical protein